MLTARFLDQHTQSQGNQGPSPSIPPNNTQNVANPQQQLTGPPGGPPGTPGAGNPAQNIPIPPAPPKPDTTPPADLTLAGVLHFLQSEWRRYERDRNEWEIERAELRARVALLEGERRSFDNVKLDLVRRIKMLEYALKAERTKQASSAPAIPANKLISLRTSDQATDSASSSSEAAPVSAPASPRSEPDVLPNGPTDTGAKSVSSEPSPPKNLGDTKSFSTKQFSKASLANLNLANLGGPPPGKDPKSRARSREYLKACLQEVNYLTSASALNPLPNRALVPAAIPPPLSQAPPVDPALGRPRRSLIGQNGPPPLPQGSVMGAMSAYSAGPPGGLSSARSEPPRLPELPNGLLGAPPGSGPGEAIPITDSSEARKAQTEDGLAKEVIPEEGSAIHLTSGSGDNVLVAEAVVPSSSGPTASDAAPAVAVSPLEPLPVEPPTESPVGGEHLPTALSTHPTSEIVSDGPEGVFSPPHEGMHPLEPQPSGVWSHDEDQHQSTLPDEGEWAERMRQARERLERADREADENQIRAMDEEMDGDMEDEDEDDTPALTDGDSVGVESESADSEAKKVWQARRTLKSHLDAVRTVSWHSRDCALATAGDDCTIKLWRLDSAWLTNPHARLSSEIEPIITYRGHSAPITSLVQSSVPTQKLLFSASLDATIRIWGVPDKAHSMAYAPFNPAYTHRATLVGHAEAVWALGMIPFASGAGELLASASADGSVKIWDVEGRGELRSTWGYDGADEDTVKKAATSVEAIKTQPNALAVAWDDAIVKIYDVENGKEVLRLKSDATYDGTPKTQINSIISHPTMPLLVTAHEDKFIRIFDLKSGNCTHSQMAHLDGVTSLSFDAQGFLLATGSHDCSVRLWDPFRDGATCIQEISSQHRTKGDEGVLNVQFHPTMQVLASAGADGVVKLYSHL
ncbi:WD40 repeat-like protein [Calocera cornea HHB12733]|uniref:WD40 repeat-like protein n=1 Tax=Calocera cornea HHB12733 TaxID=1353952 RepID=A0A165FBI3_9BASI|nr:WD40 repeat-like protein [Calocera cornea HHB12733]